MRAANVSRSLSWMSPIMISRILRPPQSQPGDHLEAIECALGRHHLADEHQHVFIPGDRVARAQILDVVVLREQRRIHTERHDRARLHVESVAAQQRTLVRGLRNDVIRVSDDAAAHDAIERAPLPGRGVQGVDGRRDVRHSVRPGKGMPEHSPEKIVADRMHDFDTAQLGRGGHLQKSGHEVVGRVACKRGLESSHHKIRRNLLANGAVRRTLGRKHHDIVFAFDKIFREASCVGAQASDGGPELMAEDGDPQCYNSRLAESGYIVPPDRLECIFRS